MERAKWRLADRRVVVTGASSGIGAAVAVALAAAGARTLLVGRDERRLSECATAATRAGGECASVACDVTADGAASRIVDAAVGRFDEIDGIVHSAGVFRMAPFESADPAELDLLYATNVRAPYVLTQAALSHLSHGASVVMMGSNLTRVAKAQMAAYSASKAAVEALARSLVVELGADGIRINAIAPGIVRTPMVEVVTGDRELAARESAATALGRLAEPEEVADAALFLLSDAARHVTGSTLVVDAGESVR